MFVALPSTHKFARALSISPAFLIKDVACSVDAQGQTCCAHSGGEKWAVGIIHGLCVGYGVDVNVECIV